MLKILTTILCFMHYCDTENIKSNNSLHSIKKNTVKSAKIIRKYIKNKQHKELYINPIKTCIHFDIQEFTTPTGINVRFIQKNDTDIVSVSYAFKNAGNISETKLGVNDCVANLMAVSNGKNLTNAEIQKISDINSIHISMHSSSDNFIGQINFPKANYKKAVEIANEIFYNLDFKDSFDFIIKKLSNNYLLMSSSPEFMLSKATVEAMFPNHRYGKIPTSDDFKKLTLTDAKETYKNLFSKKSLIVVVVGNVSKRFAIKLVDDLFGKLPENKNTVKIEKVNPKSFKNIELTKENYNTTKILFTLTSAPSVVDPDYLPVIIALQIFSLIPLDNRLINELRKKIGQVYYAHFDIQTLNFSSYFVGGTESTNKDLVIKSIRNIISKFQKYGINKYEFELAKNRLKSRVLFSVLSTSKISSYALALWLNNHKKDHINDFFTIIDNVNFEKVQEAIMKYFSTDNLNISTISGTTK